MMRNSAIFIAHYNSVNILHSKRLIHEKISRFYVRDHKLLFSVAENPKRKRNEESDTCGSIGPGLIVAITVQYICQRLVVDRLKKKTKREKK